MTEYCECCQKTLTGGLDTFGETHHPLCWDCWSTLEWEDGLPVDKRAWWSEWASDLAISKHLEEFNEDYARMEVAENG